MFFCMTVAEPDPEADAALEACIARIAGGDQEALADLYGRTRSAIYGFALSIVKNAHDAEDILHDAYLQVWNAAGGYRAQGKPMAWLLTITRNLALSRLREHGRTEPLVQEDWQDHLADAPAVTHEDRMTLEALLSALARQVPGVTADGEGVQVDIPTLLKHPKPLVMRRLRWALTQLGIHPSQVYLDGLFRLMEEGQSGDGLDLPGHRAVKSWDQLSITPQKQPEALPALPLKDGETRWGEWRVECRSTVCPHSPGTGLWLTPGDYVLRPRQVGDTLQLPKRPTKTVKKLMMEKKIPASLRQRLPVLAQGERVAAVALLGVDEGFLAAPGQPARYITITKENEDHA